MSSQKSLVIKIFAVGHRKIVDFPALAKKANLFAFLPQFNLPYDFLRPYTRKK